MSRTFSPSSLAHQRRPKRNFPQESRDRRKEHFRKTDYGYVNLAARYPFQTADGRKHVDLFDAWFNNPSGSRFIEFYRSRFC
jgi:hypothetical protein